MEAERIPRTLQAGSLRVEPAARRAFTGERELGLEPLVFDLLAALAARPGEVVAKDTLWQEVWQARPVSDSVIPHAVSKLRRALDAAGAPEQILAVHGRGYRLALAASTSPPEAAPDMGAPSAAAAPTAQAAARRTLLHTALALLAVAVAAVAVALLAGLPGTPQARPERVALLPVENATGDPALDWTAIGLLPLLDQGLSDAGVDVVSSSDVLGTLGRYPGETGEQRARRLARSSGAERVLALRLVRHETGLRLSMHDALGEGFVAVVLDGDAPVRLAVAAASSAAQQLRRLENTPEFHPALSGDPFADEAYARGLDARLRGDRDAARSLFTTVLASRPGFHPARMQLAIVERDDGEFERAAALASELLAEAGRSGDAKLRGDALVMLGVIAWRRGDLDQAETQYRDAAAAYRQAGAQHSLAAVDGNLGILAATRGRFDQAEAAMQASLAHYRGREDLYNTARLLKNLGLLATDQAQPQLARSYLQESVRIRRALDLPQEVAMTLAALADLASGAGRHEEAEALHTEILAAAEQADDRGLQALSLADRAAARLQRGALDGAGEDAARSLAIASSLDQPSLMATARSRMAEVYQARGELQPARDLLEQALAVHRQAGRPPSELEALLDLAELELTAGNREAFTARMRAAEALQAFATPAQRDRRERIIALATGDAATTGDGSGAAAQPQP